MRSFGRTTSVFALALAPALVGARTAAPNAEGPRPVWDISTGAPLRVWIQPAPAGTAPESRNVHAVRRAVAEWNAQRLRLRMRLGADSAAADVHVFWTDRFDEPISGSTKAVDDGARHILSAEVVLALRHSDGRVLSHEETRVLALHELGHAIGLDHSPDSTSVMWPRVRVRAISAADRVLAAQLYSSR